MFTALGHLLIIPQEWLPRTTKEEDESTEEDKTTRLPYNNYLNISLKPHQETSKLFEVVQGRQGLVSAADPCNAPGGKSLSERVAHALLPKPKPKLWTVPYKGQSMIT